MYPIQLLPLTGLAEIVPGDDLSALLRTALAQTGPSLGPADVLVVTQKIVSKAEGRFVDLATITPGDEARRLARITGKDPRLVELVLAESTDVVRAVPGVLITRHSLGLVMANAGIDRSNTGSGGGERVLLLPIDPDASAAALARELGCAVVISDSFGRPWRMGVTAVGIGAAGIAALDDRRSEPDRDGRPLEVTQIAVADLVASAAGLLMGEASESIPAVLIRGYRPRGRPVPASALARPIEQDLFR